jgi:hypothetical protein
MKKKRRSAATAMPFREYEKQPLPIAREQILASPFSVQDI